MIKLFHIDTNCKEGSRLPDAFVVLAKNKLLRKLIIRLPLVFRVPTFYDVYMDAVKADVWCTPAIAFTMKYPGQLEVYYILYSALEEQ